MREKGFSLIGLVILGALIMGGAAVYYFSTINPPTEEEEYIDYPPSPSASSVNISEDPGLQYLKEKYNMTDSQLEILNTVNQEGDSL